MLVRRARLQEADEIAALWLRSRSASIPHIPAPVHTDDEVRAFFEHVVLPEREVWVGDDGDAVVAVLALKDDWVDQLYVEPARTGQGIGQQLIAQAKQRRPRGLRLWTFEANLGARRFYERHGFVIVGSTPGANEEGAPDVCYEWLPTRTTDG
jgi:GNAT superfamily N-acetyltransferase